MDTKSIIFVLDAGGTGFKFSAVQDYKEIIEPFTIKTASDTLEEQLNKIIEGFRRTEELCGKPAAISFCFPGPADYTNGIIGDLANLPLFRGGVALKDMLENEFKVPVYINNDGDLFAYGEVLGGVLPEINDMLEKAGNPKRYKNLVGFTLGTGFGGGVVLDGKLLQGDNSAGAEVWCMRNILYPQTSAEDSISIRGVRRVYAREAGIEFNEAPQPFDIYEIAMGNKEGNKDAALKAWDEFAIVLADIIANIATVVDGIVVLGGGLSGASKIFMPKVVELLNKEYPGLDGNKIPRMEISAYNLDDEQGRKDFASVTGKMIKVPFSDKEVWYDPSKKIGITATKLGTSSAVCIGAYAYAMNK
ncbi:MAG: ROK family protein [Lentimicrobiaceae bacterium]|nr:ROK family protein [Lentimicrobiaceae bacterium]